MKDKSNQWVSIKIKNGTRKPVNILPGGPIVTPGNHDEFKHPLTLPLFFSVHNESEETPYPFRVGSEFRYAVKHRRIEGIEEWSVLFNRKPMETETDMVLSGAGEPAVCVAIGGY